MEDFMQDNKFEAIKYRHEDQSKLLQFMTTLDNQIYAGYFTLQIAIVGIIEQLKIDSICSKIMFSIIESTITIVGIGLLYYNHKRRDEAVKTIKNCNKALKYYEREYYIEHDKIEPETKVRSWFYFFLGGISAVCVAVILFIWTFKAIIQNVVK